jgi:hypothetical protein
MVSRGLLVDGNGNRSEARVSVENAVKRDVSVFIE